MRSIDEIKTMNAEKPKEEQNSIRTNDDGTTGIRIREINKVAIKEGDILVLRFEQRLAAGQGDKLRAIINGVVLEPIGLNGKVPVMILDDGADICVLEKQIPGAKYKEGDNDR